MNWFWINIPLGVVFFLATAGIPLWMVRRYPERGPSRQSPAGNVSRVSSPRPAPVTLAPAELAAARLAEARVPDATPQSRPVITVAPARQPVMA